MYVSSAMEWIADEAGRAVAVEGGDGVAGEAVEAAGDIARESDACAVRGFEASDALDYLVVYVHRLDGGEETD